MMKKQFTKGKDYVIIIERNYGGVPKRLKGLVSKTGRSCKRRRGSNPLSSAIFILGLVIKFFLFAIRRGETSFDDLMDVHVNSQ